MTQMEELHEQVLDVLLRWQREVSSSRVLPLFYLRRTNDERFKRGYWFPGTDDYLLVSFWAGSDMRNKTPNAYFRIHLKQGCSAHLTARDSAVKRNFFEHLAFSMPDYAPQQQKGRQAGAWSAKKSEWQEWRQALLAYAGNDKIRIDNSLLSSEAEGVGDEFDTKLTFLDPGTFDELLSRVMVQQDKLRATRNTEAAAGLPTQAPFPPGRGVISLTRFAISNFQGIHYASVEELNPAARWIFLTGENGFGKTSVLRAIAHALGGPLEVDKQATSAPDKRPVRRPQLEMGYERDGQPGGIVKTVGSAEGKLTGYLGYQLVAYGPLRLGILDDAAQNRPTKQQSNVFSLFDPIGSRLYNADYELSQAYLTGKQEGGSMNRFYQLVYLVQFITANRISLITVVPQTGQVLYREAGDDGQMVALATPYQELATGYQSLINLVVDLYLRLAGAEPAAAPEKLVGLVLIDELENHLHPHLQRELPIRLRLLFPLVQFIVSTHSPIPLLGAPDNAIFLRVDREAGTGITVQSLDVDISNLLPNAILSSPIFGFQQLVPISHDGSEWVQTGDYGTVVREQEIDRQLAQFLTEERQQKLLALLQPKK